MPTSILSVSSMVCESMIRWPRPARAPISSAETTAMKARFNATRRPLRMNGNAEGRITYALVFDLAFPTPEEIRVEGPAYLNGLGEAIGEMRRHILDLMRRGELERSQELLEAMDEIYYLLTSMDYPDAMTGGLRRTTDVARSIIERTRGDLATTIIQQGLKTALDQARKDLE